ncbi:hypothetical protein AYO44_07050 [Planctomycetaceae bacterium SCGC AG-212-F19]|nr:hypothetical protein AYO44_07050 [Planctomycetaceae bacterium SCGC AG-212-F19]
MHMPAKKKKVTQPEVVRLFSEKLRERRNEMGLTQEAVALSAGITPSHLRRLESGMAAPGLDVIARLASVLSVPVAELLPASAQADTVAALRDQSRRLFDDLMKQADREVLKVLNGLLFRLNEAQSRGR